jgi:aminoglycoside phosphotransferase family enzyme
LLVLAQSTASAKTPTPLTHDQVVTGLQRPGAYPRAIKQPVKAIRTHISSVLLTGDRVYKLQQPLKLSFIDNSTLARREANIREEFRFNRRFSPHVYMGVVPVTAQGDRVQIGGKGKVVDWALEMRQLPTDRLMSDLLAQGKVSRNDVRRLARVVAEIHAKAPRSAGRRYGSPRLVRQQVADLASVRDTVEGACKAGDKVDFVLKRSADFMKKHRKLFVARKKQGFVRECHGDLHSGNVFLTRPRLTVFDGIAFNKAFSQTDTAAEVAFVTMDLEAAGRRDLSRTFLNEYLRVTRDIGMLGVLNYYKCYRANVRAKVAALGYAKSPTEANRANMARYLDLAQTYAEGLR